MSFNIYSKKKLHQTFNPHDKNMLKGLVIIPHSKIFVTASNKELKFWDLSHVYLKKKIELKQEIQGNLIYSEQSNTIAYSLQNHINILQICHMDFCKICINDNSCVKCLPGYVLDKEKQCKAYGEEGNPIQWKFQHLDLDRTHFRMKFENLNDTQWQTVMNIDPKLAVGLVSKIEKTRTTIKEASNITEATYNSYMRSWDLKIEHKQGYGVLNITAAIIKNQTKKRDLLVTEPIWFDPHPQGIEVCSMPIPGFDLRWIYSIIGYTYRCMYWFSIAFCLFDNIIRYKYGYKLGGIIAFRYCSLYFSFSFASFLSINFRPIILPINQTLYNTMHVGYFGFKPKTPFPSVDSNIIKGMYLGNFQKLNFEIFILEKFWIEITFYTMILLASLGTMRMPVGSFFNACRSNLSFLLGPNLMMSSLLQILIALNTGIVDFYEGLNLVVGIIILFILVVDILYFIVQRLIPLTDPGITMNSSDINDSNFSEHFGSVEKENEQKGEIQSDNQKRALEADKNQGGIITARSDVINTVKINHQKKDIENPLAKSPATNDESPNLILSESKIPKNKTPPQKKVILLSGFLDTIESQQNLLEIRLISKDYESVFVHSSYINNFSARHYNMLFYLKCIFIVFISVFLNGKRIIQASIFFCFQVVMFMMVISFNHLSKKRVTVFTQEFSFLLWSMILLAVAYDDVHPYWDLLSTQVFSISLIVLRELVFILEFFLWFDHVTGLFNNWTHLRAGILNHIQYKQSPSKMSSHTQVKANISNSEGTNQKKKKEGDKNK